MERMVHDYGTSNYDFKFVIGTDLLLSSERVRSSNGSSNTNTNTNNNYNTLNDWDPRPQYKGWVDRTNFIVLQRPGYPLPLSWESRSNVQVLASPVKGGDRVTTNLSSSEVRWRIDNAAGSYPNPNLQHGKQNTANRNAKECSGSASTSGSGAGERRWTWKFGNSVQGLCDLTVINFMERHRLYTSKARDIKLEIAHNVTA